MKTKKERIQQYKARMLLYERAVTDGGFRREIAKQDGCAHKSDSDIVVHYTKHAQQLGILINYEIGR